MNPTGAQPAAPVAAYDPPAALRALEDRYEVVRELGRGGTAAVYLARERVTGRFVAIKTIHALALRDADARSRFAREAQTVAALHHPNILTPDAVEPLDDGTMALIMPYVPGGTLRDALRLDGPMSFARAADVLRDIAAALGYAHAQGIVHRDVKPENIFLDRTTGRALLSDFGIARTIGTDSTLTLQGDAVGTPTYMSPEQITGQPLDGRSDLYALGLVGWEMLTGHRPWDGETLYQVIYHQKHDELPRLTTLTPGTPEPLLFAIEGALHKDPGTRWASADEMLAQLRDAPSADAARRRRSAPEVMPTMRFRRAEPVEATSGSGPVARLEAPAPEHSTAWRYAVVLLTAAVLVGAGLSALARRTHGAASRAAVTRALDPAPAPARAAAATPGPAVPAPTPSTRSAASPARVLPRRSTRRPTSAPARTRAALPATPHADSLARCRRPGTANQRACVMALLTDGDVPLNQAYERLVVQLKRTAGTRVGDSEPESVRRLRGDQRRWLAYRDAECLRRGGGHEGALWGRTRARCLIQLGNERARSLDAFRRQIGGQ